MQTAELTPRATRSAARAPNDALDAWLEEAAGHEVPPAPLCLKIAQARHRLGEDDEACHWALRAAEAAQDFVTWQPAAALVQKLPRPGTARAAKVAVLGSYTTAQFVPMLRLAALRFGVGLEIHEGGYGQYRQEIADPQSALYAFAPDVVVLAVHEGEAILSANAGGADEAVTHELRRWTSLWDVATERGAPRVIQHNFAIAPETPLGHLDARLAGSRYAMLQALNLRLAEAAGERVTVLDCERLSALYGKKKWFDPRYWQISRQAVNLGALPLLALHTAAVLAASLGLSRKCLVLDLDNTLWGGVIGEDGFDGIRLGYDHGPQGGGFTAFQEYVLKLKERGVMLAVCSKNDEADAREPFERHPDMRLRLGDLAYFAASWQPKPEAIRGIARALNIGLDAMVFVDDNPSERQAVRRLLPEVAVVTLPADPAHYVRTLAESLWFEAATVTAEDARRTEHYQARARIAELEAGAGSMDEFHRSLAMQAVIAPFNDLDLPRIAQLLGKTNQFNLTTRRHSLEQLRGFATDPRCLHLSLRLRDRFADHGLVSVLVAFASDTVLDIDTWLMSCRVIGRTVEAAMLAELCRLAAEQGIQTIRGTYIRTAKNALVKNIYARFGFTLESEYDGTATWLYDLQANGPIENSLIQQVQSFLAS